METAACSIEIGGKIQSRDIRRLAEAIETDELGVFGDDPMSADDAETAIINASKAAKPLSLRRYDAPWGEIDAVKAVCRELRLRHVYYCEAGAEWGNYLSYWDSDDTGIGKGDDAALYAQFDTADYHGEPVLGLSELTRHLTHGTLQHAVGRMREIHDFKFPLQIVEDESAQSQSRHFRIRREDGGWTLILLRENGSENDDFGNSDRAMSIQMPNGADTAVRRSR